MDRIKVGAVKLYMWTCPRCEKHNLVDEPWSCEQTCEQCKQEVIIGPLVAAERLRMLVDNIAPGQDIEDFAFAAMQDCSVKKGRQEQTKKVIMRAFQFAFDEAKKVKAP